MLGSRGDWMQLQSGERYYPCDPRASEIHPSDIAHALSLLCRYGGHVDRFYSVAEHCVLVSRSVNPENALYALLHDATEAYVVDVPRPVKRYLTNYKKIENDIWLAICGRFGIDPHIPSEVLDADTRIILTERNALMSNAELGEWSMDGMNPIDITIEGWLPEIAENMYLKRLHELGAI